MSEAVIRPGVSMGSYPQRQLDSPGLLEGWINARITHRRVRLGRKRYSQSTIVRAVERYQDALQNCSDEAFDVVLDQLRSQLYRRGLQEALMIEAFAVIREAAGRVLGQRHFDRQLYGGWLMLNGMLTEMQTGEGKTLSATLPACTAALAGIPVHVITASDYLAERDCDLMLPLYQRLGLSGASVTDGMRSVSCQLAYEADIVHTTHSKIALDYLRDRIEMGDDTGHLRFQFRQIQRRQNLHKNRKLRLRGLCFAIIDEADSVLIDDANTPLTVTKKSSDEASADTCRDALYLASTLAAGKDYRVDEERRSVDLTTAGASVLEEHVVNLPKLWRNRRRRETWLKQALMALRFYRRDREYLVIDDKVQMIDTSSGRLMPDSVSQQGLYRMIEVKEGCRISEQGEPQARISYQRFFSRYLRLGGSSGDIYEMADELRRVYGLEVHRIDSDQPSNRMALGDRIFRDQLDKKLTLINRVQAIKQSGRPILIGTGSVEDSEQVSEWLQLAKISHRVLNARQDRHEAEAIAAAGQPGAITIATNMAGRGTAIVLGEGVEALGGLHVILLGMNDSCRAGRQLFDRAARQGDPCSVESILSLQDDAIASYYGLTMRRLLAAMTSDGRPLPEFLSHWVMRRLYKKYERKQRGLRRALMKQDQTQPRTLALSGRFEQ